VLAIQTIPGEKENALGNGHAAHVEPHPADLAAAHRHGESARTCRGAVGGHVAEGDAEVARRQLLQRDAGVDADSALRIPGYKQEIAIGVRERALGNGLDHESTAGTLLSAVDREVETGNPNGNRNGAGVGPGHRARGGDTFQPDVVATRSDRGKDRAPVRADRELRPAVQGHGVVSWKEGPGSLRGDLQGSLGGLGIRAAITAGQEG
jgi:hypothetical protein